MSIDCKPSGWRSMLLFAALVASHQTFAAKTAEAAGPFQYFAVNPCRAVDTRNPPGQNGGPILTQNSTRLFTIQGICGVPVGAKAVSINVTIASPNLQAPGAFMSFYPSDGGIPSVSTINFTNADLALANGAIVPLKNGTPPNDLAVFFNPYNVATGSVHVIVDVTGYFQ